MGLNNHKSRCWYTRSTHFSVLRSENAWECLWFLNLHLSVESSLFVALHIWSWYSIATNAVFHKCWMLWRIPLWIQELHACTEVQLKPSAVKRLTIETCMLTDLQESISSMHIPVSMYEFKAFTETRSVMSVSPPLKQGHCGLAEVWVWALLPNFAPNQSTWPGFSKEAKLYKPTA